MLLQALAQRDIGAIENAIECARLSGVEEGIIHDLSSETLTHLREEDARRSHAHELLISAMENGALATLQPAVAAAVAAGVSATAIDEARAVLRLLDAEASHRQAAEGVLRNALINDDLESLPECIKRAESAGVDAVLISAARAAVCRLRELDEARAEAQVALRGAIDMHSARANSETASMLADALLQARAATLEAPVVNAAAEALERWRRQEEVIAAEKRRRDADAADAAALAREELELRYLKEARERVQAAAECADAEEAERRAHLEEIARGKEVRRAEARRALQAQVERDASMRQALHAAVGDTAEGGGLLRRIRAKHASNGHAKDIVQRL
jgi:hypothetical protein